MSRTHVCARVGPSAAPLRCSYCHGEALARTLARCGACGTAAHAECLGAHGGCPTLGCPVSPVRRAVATTRAPVAAAEPRRTCAAAAGAAFAVGALAALGWVAHGAQCRGWGSPFSWPPCWTCEHPVPSLGAWTGGGALVGAWLGLSYAIAASWVRAELAVRARPVVRDPLRLTAGCEPSPDDAAEDEDADSPSQVARRRASVAAAAFATGVLVWLCYLLGAGSEHAHWTTWCWTFDVAPSTCWRCDHPWRDLLECAAEGLASGALFAGLLGAPLGYAYALLEADVVASIRGLRASCALTSRPPPKPGTAL